MKTLITALFFLSCTILLFAQDTIYVPSEQATIQAAIDVANNGDLVLVAEGRYYENINYNGKAISLASYFLIDRDESHIQNTIIDGSQPTNPTYGSVVTFWSGEDSSSILLGFTITGGTGMPYNGYSRVGGGIFISLASPTIKNNIIENNVVNSSANVAGSAVSIENSNNTFTFENNIVRNNLAQSSGASTFVNGTIILWRGIIGEVIIRNNLITDNILLGTNILNGGGLDVFGYNSPDRICYIENNTILRNEVALGTLSQGGGIYAENIYVIIKNNIIASNSARSGGGIWYRDDLQTPAFSSLVVNNSIINNTAQFAGAIVTNEIFEVTNCIIWGNSSPQFLGTLATITYSDIEATYTGVGNISLDPLFQDTTYYLLNNSSPCIDAGNPDPIYNDVEDPSNPGYPLWPAMGTLTNDMGHCGGPNSFWPNIIVNSIKEDEQNDIFANDYSLFQNFPNPFNPSTKIKYSIPQSSNVVIKVFDILSNEMETLIKEEKPAGTYEISWYAEQLPSGVYFYQLRAGSFVETKKMLLLK